MLKRRTKSTQAAATRGVTLADLVARHGAGDPAASVPPPSYRSNVVAYRCVRMIAEAAASVPFIVREFGEVQVDGRTPRLLAQPNPDQTGTDFLEELYGFLMTHGDAFVETLDGDAFPHAIFLIHPSAVELADDGYRVRTRRGERMIRSHLMGRSPVLHLALWQPAAGRRGLAPLDVAREAIHLHNAACAWNRQLIDNAARPSGALVHRGGQGSEHLTPEQFDRLKTELEQGFSGLRGAGRPLLLDGGLDWRPMGLTPAEMDFQNLKNSAARDIALAFGVPPMLLGIPGDNTYSNYREANLAFWRQTVLPLVRRTADALSVWLDSGRSTGLEPNVGAIEALASERVGRLDRIAGADFLTDREKRVAFGYPSVPGDA